MIICIKCSTETKTKMDFLLSKDHYRDYSELLELAVENLWMLNREIDEKGALVIGEVSSPSGFYPASPPVERASTINAGKPVPPPSSQSKATISLSSHIAPNLIRIPELFLTEGLDKLSPATVDIPPIENNEETFMLDQWLFGQYNKLLPAKANCRALFHLTAGQKNGVLLDTIGAQIVEAAAQLGDYLADHDRRHQIGRDETMATAFPRSGQGAQKSRDRYVNQFVGRMNSQNMLSGLLWDYRLAGLAPENGSFLLPTDQAIHLARLTNPILDGCQTVPTEKFSSEETSFLMNHIRSFVPKENFAFRALIQAISDGADTPDKLDEALRALVPTNLNRSLSPSFLISQRSGALSRMTDLGLIARERKGVRVSYLVTRQGQSFIEYK